VLDVGDFEQDGLGRPAHFDDTAEALKTPKTVHKLQFFNFLIQIFKKTDDCLRHCKMKLFHLGTKVVGNKNVRLVEVSGFTTLLDWFESELTV